MKEFYLDNLNYIKGGCEKRVFTDKNAEKVYKMYIEFWDELENCSNQVELLKKWEFILNEDKKEYLRLKKTFGKFLVKTNFIFWYNLDYKIDIPVNIQKKFDLSQSKIFKYNEDYIFEKNKYNQKLITELVKKLLNFYEKDDIGMLDIFGDNILCFNDKIKIIDWKIYNYNILPQITIERYKKEYIKFLEFIKKELKI